MYAFATRQIQLCERRGFVQRIAVGWTVRPNVFGSKRSWRSFMYFRCSIAAVLGSVDRADLLHSLVHCRLALSLSISMPIYIEFINFT